MILYELLSLSFDPLWFDLLYRTILLKTIRIFILFTKRKINYYLAEN